MIKQESIINTNQHMSRQQWYNQVFTQQFKLKYHQALKSSNLKIQQDIFYKQVEIQQNQYMHQIYTKPKNQLPHLVLLHGFGGTSLFSIKMFDKLFDKFQLHALDTYGIGLSSRGKWKDDMKPEEVVQYYIQSIQKWRLKSKISSKFTLVGHSFGGYIGTLYMEKYEKNIQRLILLSPPGLKKYSQQQIKGKLEDRKCMSCIGQKIFNKQITPTGMARSWTFGNCIINRLLKRLHITDEEHDSWKFYIMHLSKQKTSSQLGFYILFSWPLQPYRGFNQILEKLNTKIKIDIMFGDKDWMDKQPAYDLRKKYQNITIHIVSDSTHQLIFDNPTDVCRIIKNIYK